VRVNNRCPTTDNGKEVSAISRFFNLSRRCFWSEERLFNTWQRACSAKSYYPTRNKGIPRRSKYFVRGERPSNLEFGATAAIKSEGDVGQSDKSRVRLEWIDSDALQIAIKWWLRACASRNSNSESHQHFCENSCATNRSTHQWSLKSTTRSESLLRLYESRRLKSCIR
jgi:hypothetical protein